MPLECAAPQCELLVRQVLVLWDVDGTLIHNGGVSAETYAMAFEQLNGDPPVTPPETDGRTDYQIMRELFSANGRTLTDAMADRLFQALESAGAQNAPALRERGGALPGAIAAVSALKDEPSLVQSVLTGNILPNARVKLSAFGLDRYLDLDVGGYGSDDMVRANLVGAAQRKARAKYGVDFDEGSTLLIGDTSRDVEAGLTGGALVLGVATGKTPEHELRAADAHAVLADLTDQVLFMKTVRRLLPLAPSAVS